MLNANEFAPLVKGKTLQVYDFTNRVVRMAGQLKPFCQTSLPNSIDQVQCKERMIVNLKTPKKEVPVENLVQEKIENTSNKV